MWRPFRGRPRKALLLVTTEGNLLVQIIGTNYLLEPTSKELSQYAHNTLETIYEAQD